MSRTRHGFGRVQDFFAKHLGEMERRLTKVSGVAAVLGLIIGAVFAPTVNKDHPAGDLSTFFTAAAGAFAAIAATLFLIQLTGRARRSALVFLRRTTPFYFVVGLLASLCGLITSLPNWMYRWLFALTLASGFALLAVFVLVANASIRGQTEDEITALADRYSQLGSAPGPPKNIR